MKWFLMHTLAFSPEATCHHFHVSTSLPSLNVQPHCHLSYVLNLLHQTTALTSGSTLSKQAPSTTATKWRSASSHSSSRPTPHRQQPPAASTQKLRDIFSDRDPSTAQVLAVVTLVPLGGVLLLLAGLTFAGTLIGLFVLFSPALVPAALTIGLAVAGFLTSGAFGITGLASLTWMLRRMRELPPEQVGPAKRKMQDTAGHLGQRTKDVGQTIQEKAHDEGKAREAARA